MVVLASPIFRLAGHPDETPFHLVATPQFLVQHRAVLCSTLAECLTLVTNLTYSLPLNPMNPSEALYYPLSYYKGIAAFCAHYMGKLFSNNEVLHTREAHDDWQDRLQHFIERILLNARLDESAAIGAMILLENFYVSGAERPPYPNEAYFGYFMGAYMTANRVLASCSHPGSSQGLPSQVAGFWLDVIGDMFSQREMQQLEFDFRSLLNADVRMSTERFWEIKMYMYAFIRFRLYLRTRRWCWPVDDLQLPPCHDEMVERKKLFDYVRSRVPRLQSLSDREYYRLLIRERNRIYKM